MVVGYVHIARRSRFVVNKISLNKMVAQAIKFVAYISK